MYVYGFDFTYRCLSQNTELFAYGLTLPQIIQDNGAFIFGYLDFSENPCEVFTDGEKI